MARALQVTTDAHLIEVHAPTGVIGHWDARRIEEVVQNLLSNAVKFSHDAGRVRVRCASEAAEVRVEVEDEGIGITPELLPHVFDRFYQGRLQGKNGMAGTGLGLALAKKVVEAHGGTIRIDSETGKGTTVEFVLPLTSRDNR